MMDKNSKSPFLQIPNRSKSRFHRVFFNGIPTLRTFRKHMKSSLCCAAPSSDEGGGAPPNQLETSELVLLQMGEIGYNLQFRELSSILT